MGRVPGALVPYVTSVVAYDSELGAPGVHRGLPSTSLTLVLALDEPLDVGWADGRARGRRWSTVSGLHTGPAAIHHGGHQRGVQLALTPAGAQTLLGVPAAELAGQLLALEDVAPDLAELPERLHDLPHREASTAVVRALLGVLHGRDEKHAQSRVGPALAGLARGRSVTAVAADVGYSRRRLSTLVRQETGLAPKQYQRVARFEASRRAVGRRPLAEIAAACGYADQAHLTREWNELAGCSPSTWLREEFPFVQDHDSGLAAP